MAADGANGGCKLLYGCQQSGQLGGMLAMACLVAIVLERAPLGRVGSDRAALSCAYRRRRLVLAAHDV